MLSVNPASSGSCASSATDNSNIAAFVSQNSIGILSTVPGKPTSVVAVRGNASLAVTWTAPANTGGSAITDYLLKYSSNSGSTWTNFLHPVSTVPSLTVTGLTNGTAYVIKLIAKNAVGISLPSANSAPATPATVPGKPTSVVAVRGNASLAVTWTPPATTGGSAITNYLVKYSSNSGSTWTTFVRAASTVTSCTVTGLSNGTPYVFKVIARNAVGSSLPSASSAPVTPTSMSMVTVGNPGNAADTTGYGAVSYSYQIGKYDVTGSQYTAFLNAVGSTDNYALYNPNMGTDTQAAQISRSGTAGTYTYAVMNGTGTRPISYVSWWDSARFSNWMSNGQPSGAQVSTTTENGAYNVNGFTSGSAVFKNTTNPNTGFAPTYRIPLENEWYKAAYYAQGALFSGYHTFATRSSTAPGTTIGSGANQANYNGVIGHATDVGSFSGSGSFYGTFDQSGNVLQWNDNDLNGTTGGSSRGLRGGYWSYSSHDGVSSSYRYFNDPSYENGYVGFRLASPV